MHMPRTPLHTGLRREYILHGQWQIYFAQGSALKFFKNVLPNAKKNVFAIEIACKFCVTKSHS